MPISTPHGIIVVPVQTTMPVQTILALLQLHKPGSATVQLVQEWTSPAEKRNSVIPRFLADPILEWIFFLDSDMVPSADTLERLLATEREIVGGLYAGRAFDPQSTAITYSMECGYFERSTSPIMPEVVGQLAAVDWVGAGALLIRRRVLEHLAPGPWFDNEDDIGFCRRAGKAGFQVFVDGRVRVGHLQLVPVMPGELTIPGLNITVPQL